MLVLNNMGGEQMFELLREYSLPLFSLFLIVWCIWRMAKDKREKKNVAKKELFTVGVGIIIMLVVAYMIITLKG